MFTTKNIFSSFLLFFFCSPFLFAQIDIVLDTANGTSVSCAFGVPCDGQFTALATGGAGGTGNYTFEWSSGEIFSDVPSSTAVALCQGSQSVTVTDGVDEAVAFFSISAPEPLSFDISEIDVTEPSCFGDSDGSASVGAAGGTPGYNYQWNDPATIGPTIDGIPAGIYFVTVTDVYGCSNSIAISVDEPDPLAIVIDSIDNGGYLSIHTTGGTFGEINYQWSPDVSNDSIGTNLPSGDYSITATDVNGCSANITATMDNTTSTTKVNNNSYTFDLFPNPARHFFKIETDFPLEEVTQILLYDNLGQVVFMDSDVDFFSQKMNVRFLTAGGYYLKVGLRDGSFISRKLVVE